MTRISSQRHLRILFVVDFRSEIARGWIEQVASRGHIVHVVSTFPASTSAEADIPVESINLGFSKLVGLRRDHIRDYKPGNVQRGVSALVSSSAARRTWHAANAGLSRVEVARHRSVLTRRTSEFKPHLIHSMRIPYEGVLAAGFDPKLPTLVSIWGNDLTLWAARRRTMAAATRRVLTTMSALHCDCYRDLRLAERYGFIRSKPHIVLPGGGGVDTAQFHPGLPKAEVLDQFGIPTHRKVVINPRGTREYVHQESFLNAWPTVLKAHPEAVAVCPGLARDARAQGLVRSLGIAGSVLLLPKLTKADLAEAFRASAVTVSPTSHDGTPNTLLEAMASGCLPVAGAIDSVEEWISHGQNGLLCDPRDPLALAGAMIRALSDEVLFTAARRHNLSMVSTRAERTSVMSSAIEFYRRAIANYGRTASPK